MFLRGTYRLNDNKFSPIGSVDFGTRIYRDGGYHEEKFDGITPQKGIFLTPAIGADLRTTNNSYLTFKIGYEFTLAFKKKEFGDFASCKRHSMSGFFLSLGWPHTFNLGGNWFK